MSLPRCAQGEITNPEAAENFKHYQEQQRLQAPPPLPPLPASATQAPAVEKQETKDSAKLLPSVTSAKGRKRSKA